MSELSYFLAERVLHNSVNVMTHQRDELGIKEYPLFSHDEVDQIEPRFQGFKYNREIDWAAFHKTRAGFLSPTLEFYDAGHALGSAGIMVRGQKETLFYTGDVCFHDQTILRRARFEDVQADVVVLETTRGNRELPPGFTRASEIERLARSIEQVLQHKGSVLIPAFALGRTQEILALLALMMTEGKLQPQPIYIGGLGRVFTEIYDLESHRTHRQYPSLQLHETLNLVVLEQGQAEKMKLTGGRIFVVTAGMMSENTAAHNLALRMIRELESTPRGAYCGALGLCQGERAVFSLLIRTATSAPGDAGWVYGVGGGIVFDSDPRAEFEELEVKLGVLRPSPGGP